MVLVSILDLLGTAGSAARGVDVQLQVAREASDVKSALFALESAHDYALQAFAEIEVATNYLGWKKAQGAGANYLSARQWDFTQACAAVENIVQDALEAYDKAD